MLFTAVATAAKRCMCDFSPQNLANTAWAFATVGQNDQALFEALATGAERRMYEMHQKKVLSLLEKMVNANDTTFIMGVPRRLIDPKI